MMATESNYLTAEGAKRLTEELEYLKGPARVQLAERLRAAIQQGDLSENADYHAAKEEQGFLEGRIMELEQILHNAVIIEDVEKKPDEVGIGSYVTIQEEDYPEETYHLVGPKEADPRNMRISHASPIGSVLMGRRVGDKVTAKTPSGAIELKILKIEHK
jgi:transcription elongation factor GreA